MLSLWANWLQLNSQLNSPGVSFWLYRTLNFNTEYGVIEKNILQMHEFCLIVILIVFNEKFSKFMNSFVFIGE